VSQLMTAGDCRELQVADIIITIIIITISISIIITIIVITRALYWTPSCSCW